MTSSTHRARWIVPIDSPPIENGRLLVEAGRIVALDRARTPSPGDVDHGDAVILPGFVNAHTHLELTPLLGRVPFAGSFVGWVERLVAARLTDAAATDPHTAIREGIRQSLAAGVTTIGDIGYGPHAVAAWSEADPSIVGYLEILGIAGRSSLSHPQSFDTVRSACDTIPSSDRCRVGLSPHAPYSVETTIYQQAIALAQSTHRPICTHLAETRDEHRFLADATGPFRDLLERWNLWDNSFRPPGCSPVQYVDRLGLLDCEPLLIHVNYLDDADLDTLSRHRCHVAFCPRSHRFFRHEPHRWPEMLDRAINVCVATDSLASNESLSVLDELRFLHRAPSAARPKTLLHMGTLAGARALGLESTCGSLAPGKSADFTILPLDDPGTSDPFETVLESDTPPGTVYLRGNRVGP